MPDLAGRVTRAERAVEAAKLRATGLLLREVAARMGISTSYVSELVTDRDGTAVRKRKRGYAGTCERCGGPTSGTSGGLAKTPTICRACHSAVYWTSERIIDAIQRWASEHGGIPPTMVDWNPSHQSATEAQKAAYRSCPYELPNHTTVQRAFGSWNAGLIAAGYEPHRTRDMGRFADFDATVLARVRAGDSTTSIAADLDTTPENIIAALQYRGYRVKDLRPR